MRKYNIVLPLGTGSQWGDNEAKYMLRSLGENMPEHDVYVVTEGNKLPDWMCNVHGIDIERYYPPKIQRFYKGIKHYEQFYCTLKKLDIINNILGEDFIWIYDDVLLLKSIDDAMLTSVIANHEVEKKHLMMMRNGKWGRTIEKACRLSQGYSSKTYDYETHLPRYFDHDLLRKMFKTFDYREMEIPYSPSTLYYNVYFEEPDVLLNENLNIKAGFYGLDYGKPNCYSAESRDSLDNAVEDKYWINYNDSGLNKGMLKEYIHCLFPKKSRYEK